MSSSPEFSGLQPRQPQRTAAFGTLRDLLERRVLLLDGAMGTMIQRHQLTEQDFRGEILKNHP
jgi:5-methyltetrahydrofolate--homocysteine methyltransferase